MTAPPLLSIIIPIYKVEIYQDQCIESIVNQTYLNLEIFLIDDGSPDNCGDICDEWAKKDERIIVIHQANQGVSEARNVTLRVAKGDFIAFYDSDDIVPPDAIETLYKYFDESIGIVSGNFVKNGETFSYERNWDITKKQTHNGTDAFKLLFNGVINHTISSKLFKKKLLIAYNFQKGDSAKINGSQS